MVGYTVNDYHLCETKSKRIIVKFDETCYPYEEKSDDAPLVILQLDEEEGECPDMQQVADAASGHGEILDFHDDDDNDEVDTEDPAEDEPNQAQAPW